MEGDLNAPKLIKNSAVEDPQVLERAKLPNQAER